MRKSKFRKGLVVAVIVLFIGAGVIPSTIGIIEKKTTFTGRNYSGYIQDLIDNASDGDTIYIPSGTYYENIIINKSISLIGEDKVTTIIDAGFIEDVIYISANWVNISGFTIKNSGWYWDGYDGIDVRSNYNNITDNIINSNTHGIKLDHSNGNTIKDNTFTSHLYSEIWIHYSNKIDTKNYK